MPRKAQRKYGPNGEYYRKLIKGADGKYVPVYGKTLASQPLRICRLRSCTSLNTLPVSMPGARRT